MKPLTDAVVRSTYAHTAAYGRECSAVRCTRHCESCIGDSAICSESSQKRSTLRRTPARQLSLLYAHIVSRTRTPDHPTPRATIYIVTATHSPTPCLLSFYHPLAVYHQIDPTPYNHHTLLLRMLQLLPQLPPLLQLTLPTPLQLHSYTPLTWIISYSTHYVLYTM